MSVGRGANTLLQNESTVSMETSETTKKPCVPPPIQGAKRAAQIYFVGAILGQHRTIPALWLKHRSGICVAKMLDNVGLRNPHRASGAKAPRTLRPLPLLRFAVSATGGAHLCSVQYYLRFWLSSCRTSLAVSALRIMRYCPKTISPADAEVILRLQGIFVLEIFLEFCVVECCVLYGFGTVKTVPYRALYNVQ